MIKQLIRFDLIMLQTHFQNNNYILFQSFRACNSEETLILEYIFVFLQP